MSRTISSARNRLEELLQETAEAPVNRWAINPDFDPTDLDSQQVIRLANVSKRYGDNALFAGISKTVTNGERIVIVGPNGSGKSTLLKIIMGLVQPDEGEVRIAPRAKLGYLDQEQESLDWNSTVLEEYSREVAGAEAELRASLHKFGLFAGDQVFLKVANLSVGQQRKLLIAKVISARANVLVLDEPTNHLDLASLEQFEQALHDFRGTLVAASHDRWFINRIATQVWHLQNGQIQAAAISI